jgi:hypothetical protein
MSLGQIHEEPEKMAKIPTGDLVPDGRIISLEKIPEDLWKMAKIPKILSETIMKSGL